MIFWSLAVVVPILESMMRVRQLLIALSLMGCVAGCGGSGDHAGKDTKTAHGSGTPDSSTRFSGIALFQSEKSDGGPGRQSLLAFHDPRTGRATMRIAFPGITAKIEDERDSFSPDWRFVAWADDNGMIGLGRFDSGRSAYVPAGTVTPPKPSFDGDQVTYDVPRFSPATGRLWFRVHKTATETALVSVDPRSPAGPPRTEQAPPGMGIGWYFAPTGTPVGSDDQTARLTGTSGKKLVLTYLGSAAELMKARIRDGVGRHDPSSTFDEYEEFARLDGTTFLALNSASAIEKYGPLIEVRTDLAHKRATVTKLVPGTGQNQITGAVLGPDHRSLLLDTARGWFRTELGSTAEPQPAFDRLGDPDMGDASDLGWF